MMKSWFDFGIFRLLARLGEKPSSVLVAISSVYKLNQSAIGDHELFPCDYEKRTITNMRGPAAMSCRLPNL